MDYMEQTTPRRSSLTARTRAVAQAYLQGEKKGGLSVLAFAGPAIVASIAYMDPGNFATNIQAGAKYGYSLLWVVLLANIIAMLFQALSAKLGIVTGRNLAELCRDRFPRPVVLTMWVVSEIAAMATDLAEFLGGALGLALLLHMPLLHLLGLLLVALFRSSSALASAYGIAVTGTMVVTAIMAIVVIWRVWRWRLIWALALMLPFLFIDLTFLTANLLKIVEGGWMPLALGALVMAVMYTWRRGSRLLFEKTRRLETPLEPLVVSLEKKPPARVPGTAVFLTSDPTSAPTALMHSLKHYKVLHEKNVILTIETASTPRVDPSERVKLEQMSPTFTKVALKFGFMETPNVPKALAIARKLGWQFDIMSTSFFLSRRALKPAAHSGMPRWQDHLFIALSRTANDATDYFQIPSGRVVEVGTQITV